MTAVEVCIDAPAQSLVFTEVWGRPPRRVPPQRPDRIGSVRFSRDHSQTDSVALLWGEVALVSRPASGFWRPPRSHPEYRGQSERIATLESRRLELKTQFARTLP